MITAQVKLRETEASFRNKVYRALLQEIRQKFPNLQQILQSKFVEIFDDTIRKSPEYHSLMTPGQYNLSADFGFEVGTEEAHVKPIIEKWEKQRKVLEKIPFAIRGGTISGGITIGFINSDFEEVTNIWGVSVYPSVNKKGELSTVDWLRWLLTVGDQIFPGYWIKYGEKLKGSRSEHALMIRGKSRGWHVNPAFSGVIGNNWITRVLEEVKPRLLTEMIRIIQG